MENHQKKDSAQQPTKTVAHRQTTLPPTPLETDSKPQVTPTSTTPKVSFEKTKTAHSKKEVTPRSKPYKRDPASVSEFEERVVKIKRISKTTKGGRMMRFSALVVIGDKKGTVGYGMGKSIEVPDAIKKAIKNANNNLHKIKQTKNGSIFHDVNGHHGAVDVMLLPAPKGTGIIAGGPVRAVVELAGFTDIYTKARGSSAPMNVIRATIHGLQQQLTPKEIARLRDKELKNL